jgi:hypothetical protein
MNITPTPEYLEACRVVLGDDSPRTVLDLMMKGSPLMDEVRRAHAEILDRKRRELVGIGMNPDGTTFRIIDDPNANDRVIVVEDGDGNDKTSN